MSEREAPPRGESRLISDEPKSARRRRGGGASAGRVKGALEQSPWKQPVYLDAPFGPLTEEGVHAVHDAAMRVLEEVGIEFLNDEARAIHRRRTGREPRA